MPTPDSEVGCINLVPSLVQFIACDPLPDTNTNAIWTPMPGLIWSTDCRSRVEWTIDYVMRNYGDLMRRLAE